MSRTTSSYDQTRRELADESAFRRVGLSAYRSLMSEWGINKT